MTDVDMVQLLACCTVEEAQCALNEHHTVEAAVDALMVIPVVTGTKHIPKIQRQVFNDSEQEARCAMGRMLMDKLTAVSSAAQTKIRSGQQLAEDAVSQGSEALEQQVSMPVSESQPGSDAGTLPSSQQSDLPQ
jgi:hypothetical protein